MSDSEAGAEEVDWRTRAEVFERRYRRLFKAVEEIHTTMSESEVFKPEEREALRAVFESVKEEAQKADEALDNGDAVGSMDDEAGDEEAFRLEYYDMGPGNGYIPLIPPSPGYWRMPNWSVWGGKVCVMWQRAPIQEVHVFGQPGDTDPNAN